MAEALDKKADDVGAGGADEVKEEKAEEAKVDADVLEEDDDFEEFEDDHWNDVKPVPEDELQWEDDWDDEEDDDDFAKRLREELAKGDTAAARS
jgi:26 proteasome complex subunit DSS1